MKKLNTRFQKVPLADALKKVAAKDASPPVAKPATKKEPYAVPVKPAPPDGRTGRR